MNARRDTDVAAAARDPRRKSPGARRLFFALWPDDEQRAALASAARPVVEAAGGRAVPVENYHLTLAFLGAVPERRLAELDSVAARVAAEWRAAASGPIHVRLERLEHWARPQVLAATATGEPAAARLAEGLKAEVSAIGLAPDPKPFRPHVTLARKVARGPAGQALLPARDWSFAAFALVESRTSSGGAAYSVVASWVLSDDAKAFENPGKISI